MTRAPRKSLKQVRKSWLPDAIPNCWRARRKAFLQGGDRRRLVAKVFGAANVLPALQSPTAGELNATFVRDFLATERIPLVAQRLGGKHAVQVHFRTDTGKTIVHSVEGSRLPTILSTEAYRYDYAKAGSSGDIDLF